MKMSTSWRALVALCLIPVLGGCRTQSAGGPVPALPGSPSAPASAAAAPLTGTLTLGVPCGLAMAYKQARDLFVQANPGVKTVEHIKNVGPMTRELLDDKVKMDVFLSLGEEEIAALKQAGKLQGEGTPFLRQSMQLIVQKGNPLGIKRVEDLAGPKVKTVAICTPARTLGRAAEDALKGAGVWDKLAQGKKLIRLDQPMQTKELVFQGKADAAFIYAACSTEEFNEADPERSVIGKAQVVMTVPEDTYGGMFAVAAVPASATNPEVAKRFIEFLLTPEAQAAMAKLGYGRVDAKESAKP